jgi:hypothetical protein
MTLHPSAALVYVPFLTDGETASLDASFTAN